MKDKSDVPNWKDSIPFDGPYEGPKVPRFSGRVRTMFNYDPSEFPGEKYTLPSNTVPSVSLTIRDMYQRITRGLEVRGPNMNRFTELPPDEVDGVLTPDSGLVDPSRMNPMDLMDAYRQAEKDVKSIHDEARAELKDKGEKAALKAAQEAATAAAKASGKDAQSTNNT